MEGRILIADGMPTQRIILKARVAETGFAVEQSNTLGAALRACAAAVPDLVILSDALDHLGGPAALTRLRAVAGMENVPIIALTDDDTRAARLALLQAGADAVAGRCPDGAALRARMRSLLQRRAADAELGGAIPPRDGAALDGFALAEPPAPAFRPAGRIAIVCPDAPRAIRWRQDLSRRMRDNFFVVDPSHALAELGREPPPDAVILTQESTDPSAALRLLSDLRCRSGTLRSVVILVQDDPDPDSASMALDFGVSDVLEGGFDGDELAVILRRELARKARADDRRRTLAAGLRMAATDPLTGLFNRRAGLAKLNRMLGTARREGTALAVMMIDLDHFKAINDRHGHAAGDTVLRTVATRMREALRHDDLLARYGGEEFLAALRGPSRAEALRAAERLRGAISAGPVPLGDGATRLTVSASIGVAELAGDRAGDVLAETLIDLADRSLYAAKAAGRDTVVMAPPGVRGAEGSTTVVPAGGSAVA